MSKRSSKSVEEKREIVRLYLEKEQSASHLARQFSVESKTIQNWVRKYHQNGAAGLKESRHWKDFSLELKEQAVLEYLEGRGSLFALAEKYNISDASVLRSWIKRYTKGLSGCD